VDGADGGRSLILNGHVDVVSAEPVAAWETDPFAPTRRGDRLYGRGAWDMKSGLAMHLMLARLLHETGVDLAGDLIVQSVVEEECTGNGALAAADRDRADAALIAESTNGRFIRAHVGVAWFSVTVTGRSWHAAHASQGVNAIEKSVPVIGALRRLDDALNAAAHPLYAGADHPINLNIGAMHAGDWPSTVPGEARMDCRVSFFPGETMADLRSRVEGAVAGVARTDPWLREHPPVVTWHGFRSEGSVVAVDHPFVQRIADWHGRLRGGPLEWEAATAICDMKVFNLAGVACGCYGATGGNAHGANEWLDVTSLATTMKVIGAALLDWCGIANGG
jgi:acetylornithine deacetylase